MLRGRGGNLQLTPRKRNILPENPYIELLIKFNCTINSIVIK